MGAMIGVDVGQHNEASGICAVVEERQVSSSLPNTLQNRFSRQQERHFVVKHLERVPSGTRFPDIAKRVGNVVLKAIEEVGSSGPLFVNATGLGSPIVQLIKSHSHSATIYTTYFTYGDRRTCERQEITLGKAYLVSRLQLLLQTDRLHMPKTAQTELLAKELRNYQIEVDENANDRYGAFKVGSTDELVTALGMVVSGPAPGLVFGPDGRWA